MAVLRAGRLVTMAVLSELRKQQRIRARLTGPLPAVPANLQTTVESRGGTNGEVVIQSQGEELGPILAWVATLPLEQIRIEPWGLRRVYEKIHGGHET